MLKNPKLLITMFVLIALAFTIPLWNGTLKALGILERDFITSTTGAIYESVGKNFTVKIGDASNPQTASLELILNGKSVKFNPIKTFNYPEPASSSAETANDLTDQLDQLTKNINQLESETLKMTGNTYQTYFGPFETIRQSQIFGGETSYYLKDNQLIQEIKIVDNLSQLDFQFISESSHIIISPDQTWLIMSDDTQLFKIENLLTDTNGQTVSLPEVEEQTIRPQINNHATISLPTSLVDNYSSTFPLTLKRIFTPVVGNQVFRKSEYEKYSTSNNIALLDTYRSFLISYDKTEKSLIAWDGTNPIPLLNSIDILGISCSETMCVFNTNSAIYQINPEQLMTETDPTLRSQLPETISGVSSPIGGATVDNFNLYYTINSDPIGRLERKNLSNSTSATLLSNLTFPRDISAASDTIAFISSGQLWYQNADTWQQLNLPEQIINFHMSDDKRIYIITPYPPAQSNIVIRFEPNNKTIEILSGTYGNFSAVAVSKTHLYLSAVGQNYGKIFEIPLDTANWITTTEFTKQP